MIKFKPTVILVSIMAICGCQSPSGEKSATEKTDSSMIRLLTLDPGHFHAALVQKISYPDIDTNVHVYAPDGAEVLSYLNLVKQYNERTENPTHWNEIVYKGNDFAEKMFAEKKGNVVVLSGNNRLKTDYIKSAIDAGLNVLADKPMAIDTENFSKLVQAFDDAKKNNVLLYDIMTERSEITNILQKELLQDTTLFGQIKKGSEKDPSVFIESIHYFFKSVSGKPLVRPSWFFDPSQQGHAIADVTTHLVDLVQWQCLPEISLDYNNDINITAARAWATPLTPTQFASITGQNKYPDYLRPYIEKDSVLQTHANGEINYTIKGIPVKIIARWDYKAAAGGDSHYATVKGTKCTLEIRQGKDENYKPILYIIPSGGKHTDGIVQQSVAAISEKYPGVAVEKVNNKEWKVIIPAKYDVGHEAHFGQVMERYLQYLKNKKLPEWEIPGMLAKYYTTTKALEIAMKK